VLRNFKINKAMGGDELNEARKYDGEEMKK